MAKNQLRQRAIELRKKGMSFNQILERIDISKSTLSIWLRHYPLTTEQCKKLISNNGRKIEKFRQTMEAKREKRLTITYQEQKANHTPLNKGELFIAGLFLYWGEGGKDIKRGLSIHNTNPHIMQFVLLWYTRVLKIQKENVKVYLHLYSDMDINKEIKYWSNVLGLSSSQFIKPYPIKARLGMEPAAW